MASNVNKHMQECMQGSQRHGSSSQLEQKVVFADMHTAGLLVQTA